jgi:hypothetical protein
MAPETHFLVTTATDGFRIKKSELFPIQKNYTYALQQLHKKGNLKAEEVDFSAEDKDTRSLREGFVA